MNILANIVYLISDSDDSDIDRELSARDLTSRDLAAYE